MRDRGTCRAQDGGPAPKVKYGSVFSEAMNVNFRGRICRFAYKYLFLTIFNALLRPAKQIHMHYFVDGNLLPADAVRLKMKNDMRNHPDFITASQEKYIFLLA